MSRKGKIDLVLEGVTIEAVAAEGKALAHVYLPGDETEGPGRVVFVEFAVPGDIVDIRVLKKKKNYVEGRIERIVKPSESRLAPFCEHFGVCGGCRWQPLPYGMQLLAKQRQVYDQLVRIGHLDIPAILPIIGSDKTEYYRNKLEFSFSQKRWILDGENPDSLSDSERCALGFHVSKFFDKVLDINHCSLQPEPSNAIRLFLKKYALEHSLPFYNLRENHGLMRTLFIRTNEAGDTMVIVCFAQPSSEIKPMLDALQAEFPQITSLWYIINSKLNDSISDQECILHSGADAIYETMENLKFKIRPKSFFQTNTPQAYKLYSVAREFAGLTGSEVVYDLYTGTGTIAQFVSSKASKVIGIEYVEDAIEDARLNAAANGIGNCEFFAGDMKDVLTGSFVREHGRPDVMIVDPPRAGMHPDVVKVILEAAPCRIVYVSCNPASQARDIALLSEKYKVAAVQPVDMFPHTQHVENVCKLELI